MRTIDRDELKTMRESGDPVTLIEVLPRESFEDFHLPGAINSPVGSEDFDARVRSSVGKDEEVVVYCRDADCDASPKAAKRMERLGCARVSDYAAGKDDWKAANLPVE